MSNKSLSLTEYSYKRTPFLVFHGFMESIFDWENLFETKEKIIVGTCNGESRTRERYHITRSDLITALTLNALCNTNGRINNVSYTVIHDELNNLFEDGVKASGIHFQELLYTLRKMELNGNISIETNERTNRINIQLLHIERHNGRFVAFHPIFFSKQLANWSVGHWKVAIAAILQTGEHKNKKIARSFDKELPPSKSRLFSCGFKQLLHKKQNYDVKVILNDLFTTPLEQGQPLFTLPEGVLDAFKVSGKRLEVVRFCLNPYFHIHRKKGERMRTNLTTKQRYPRIASFIKQLLQEHKIGELETVYDGEAFDELVYLLKRTGKDIMREIIVQLKKFVQENKEFPKHIYYFANKHLSEGRIARIQKVVRSEQIDEWIAPFLTGKEREEREKTFFERLKELSIPKIRKICRLAKPKLETLYRKDSVYELKQYVWVKELKGKVMHLDLIRTIAYQQKKSAFDYRRVEIEALERWKQYHESPKILGEWMLVQVDLLPSVKTQAEPIFEKYDRLQLEDYLLTLL